MLKDLTAYFDCNSNVVSEYWITVKESGIVGLKVFYNCQISPFFPPLYVRCPRTISKFLQRFSEIYFILSFVSSR